MNDLNKTDRRCIKTRKAIKNVLIRLMTEKNISQITIKEIADEADINRKTFYSHYADATAVLDDIENDVIEKLDEIISNSDIKKIIYNPYPIFKELTNIINEDFDFYKYLIQAASISKLLDKIKYVLKNKIADMVGSEIKKNKEMLPFAIEFAVSGTLSVYQEWFNSDRTYSLEEISEVAGSLNFEGPYTIFK